MRAIILAAGRGSRMKGLTANHPKCLVNLQGKTLLNWQLDALKNAGISQIGIVTGYRRECLSDLGLVEFQNERWSETNMVSSLLCADSWLKEAPCIVSYSDIFYASEAVSLLLDSCADLAVTYDPDWLKLWKRRFEDPLSDAETLRINAESILLEIGNQPSSVEKIQGQYMGLLRFSPAGWAELFRISKSLSSSELNKISMTSMLQKIIEENSIPIKGISFQGVWGEVDSAEDLEIYNAD